MKLFPSTLITCQNQDKIQKKIDNLIESLNHKSLANNPDINIINQSTGWTIDLVRQLKKFLAQKPFNHQNKIALISDAHNLNIESQNALLKTLEEPGKDNYVILTTNKASKLLPTIISRCHIIKLKNQNPEKIGNKAIEFTSDIKKNLNLSESISKNKDQILPFLEEQLQIYQQLLIKNPSPQNSQIIKKIIKAINMIQANVDPKSALDTIFL